MPRKLPPILNRAEIKAVGLRPRCLHCGHELRPNIRHGYESSKTILVPSSRVFTGEYGHMNYFCSIAHGYSWAVCLLNNGGHHQGFALIGKTLALVTGRKSHGS